MPAIPEPLAGGAWPQPGEPMMEFLACPRHIAPGERCRGGLTAPSAPLELTEPLCALDWGPCRQYDPALILTPRV